MHTQNIQVAELPVLSENTYVTVVFPTEKNDPGLWDLSVRDVTPEISVAVGPVHTAIVPVVPSSTSNGTSSVHTTTGGVVSTIIHKNNSMKVSHIGNFFKTTPYGTLLFELGIW